MMRGGFLSVLNILENFCFLEISLSVVIPVVKGDSAASSRRREKPENARVVQAFSVSALRIMDSTAALPKHRLLYFVYYTGPAGFSHSAA